MTEIATPNTYPEPSPELIADIRQRLVDVPADVLERAHDALMHKPIQVAGNLLYKAGACLGSAELYEYRKTLFPPNALVDPLTQDAPVLRHPDAGEETTASEHRSADRTEADTSRRSLAEAGPLTDNGQETNAKPPTATSEPPPPFASPSESINDQPSSINATGASLLGDLRDVIKRYVVLPDMAAETLALWVVHTYAFTLRQVTTYIGVVSPEKRCGKTTLLELLARLANRSLTAANISPSAMFRVIEETQPTLLIDEADTFLEGRDELAGILNAGYRKGNSYVVRVADRKARRGATSYASPQTDPGRASSASPLSSTTPEFGEWTNECPHGSPDTTKPNPEPGTANRERSGLARYSCWCPKVMAAIGRLPDTLADRCIIITMQRKMSGEKCERMRCLNATDLRRRCAEFVHEHSEKIAEAQPEIPPALNDRAADIWEPLLAIADLAGGDWPQLARQAAQKLSTQDDELTLIGYFLKDLRNLMVLSNADRMLCREIVTHLNPRHDRPWEDLRRGREINEWWLGRLLADLGLRSRTMRANDTISRGYLLADIEAAFRRYVPNPDLHTILPPSESAASSLPAIDAEMEKDVVRLMRKLKPNKQSHESI